MTKIEEERPITTTNCGNCGKIIYQGELCSCKKKDDNPLKK